MHKPFPFEDLAQRYDPAEEVVQRFGGYTPLAKLLGIEPSTVMRWCQSRRVNGTGGVVPPSRWDAILAASRQRGFPLTRDDLSQPPVLRAQAYGK
jgi:DNA-binding transcriptional regulator YdaS (Cro superfamily)